MDYESILLTLVLIYFVLFVVCIAYAVVTIVADWKLFERASEKGWKSLIPFYSDYTMYKLVWDVKYFWYWAGALFATMFLNIATEVVNNGFLLVILALLSLGVSVGTLVIRWFFSQNMAKAYGKGKYYGWAMFFLGSVLRIHLGFSDGSYIGPQK